MRVFKHRNFSKWAKSERLKDAALLKVVEELESGLIEADLGSGLYKKRIARQGMGKRSGFRVLLAFKPNSYVFFLYGFAKNDKGNINSVERDLYSELAKSLLCIDEPSIKQLLQSEKLVELRYGK